MRVKNTNTHQLADYIFHQNLSSYLSIFSFLLSQEKLFFSEKSIQCELFTYNFTSDCQEINLFLHLVIFLNQLSAIE